MAVRLDRRFRWAVYATVAALLVTGVAWIVADAQKDQANGEMWQQVAADLLMCHGGAAMVMLLLLGALAAPHIGCGWRAGRNLVTGVAMATTGAVLVVTAFGLYYLGSDAVRHWCGGVHIGFGMALPGLFLVHVWTGRRRTENHRRPTMKNEVYINSKLGSADASSNKPARWARTITL